MALRLRSRLLQYVVYSRSSVSECSVLSLTNPLRHAGSTIADGRLSLFRQIRAAD